MKYFVSKKIPLLKVPRIKYAKDGSKAWYKYQVYLPNHRKADQFGYVHLASGRDTHFFKQIHSPIKEKH